MSVGCPIYSKISRQRFLQIFEVDLSCARGKADPGYPNDYVSNLEAVYLPIQRYSMGEQ